MSNLDHRAKDNDGDDEPPLSSVLSWASLSISLLGLTSISSSESTPVRPTATPTSATETKIVTMTATETSNSLATTTPSRFTPNGNDKTEWETFCEDVGVSSPKHINKALSEVKEDTNLILRRSLLLKQPGVTGHYYTWDDLDQLQKAGMAFIINEGIKASLPAGTNANIFITYGVLAKDKVETDGSTSIPGKQSGDGLSNLFGKEVTLLLQSAIRPRTLEKKIQTVPSQKKRVADRK
jgi:hypothetical protein